MGHKEDWLYDPQTINGKQLALLKQVKCHHRNKKLPLSPASRLVDTEAFLLGYNYITIKNSKPKH